MKWTREELKTAFKQELPGLRSHDLVMSYPRPSIDEVLASDRNPRRSAVVFLLYPKGEEWHFLLLKRHDYKGVHSGQVGLPGGSLDKGESSSQAAIRELHEESGLLIDSTAVIAELTPLYIPPSNFVVQPYAAIVDSEPRWKFDSHEVKRGIEVSIENLLRKDSLSETTVKMSGGNTRLKVNAYSFEGETVWGATAMILSECKEILRTLA